MLVNEAEMEQIKACDFDQLSQKSSFTFSIKRDDSSHSSFVNYYDLTTRTHKQFRFDIGK